MKRLPQRNYLKVLLKSTFKSSLSTNYIYFFKKKKIIFILTKILNFLTSLTNPLINTIFDQREPKNYLLFIF